jgi:hypothetical protein
MTEPGDWREPTDFERRLVLRLLDVLSDETSELRASKTHLETAMFRHVHDDDCIECQLPNVPHTGPKARATSEARDVDDGPIWATLFVTSEGIISELEIVKADDTPIVAMPEPTQFRVWRVDMGPGPRAGHE